MNSINKPMGLRRGNLLLGLLLVLLCFAVVWGGMNAAWAAPSGNEMIEYDANGGINPPASHYWHPIGAETRPVAGQGEMTNGARTFLGWSSVATDTEPTIFPDQILSWDDWRSLSSSDLLTLYAVWSPPVDPTPVDPTPLGDFTLSYDANGGVNPPASTVVTLYGDEAAISFTVKGQKGMTKAGCVFRGWGDDPREEWPTYEPGDVLTINAPKLDSNITLYAIWAPDSASDSDSLQITATVPARLPIHIDASGNAVVSQNAAITNNSAFGLTCTGISVQPQNGWTQVSEGYNFAMDKAGAKNFALVCALASDIIPTGESVGVNYNAKLSPSEQGFTGEQIATVTYTLEWDGLYTVKWVDDDGTLFTTQNGVDFGNPPDTSSVKFPGALPTKEGYTLTGWNVTASGATVTCEAVWQALADDASIDWEYTTDDATGTITLTKYIGESNDVVVKNKYLAGGKVYENVALGTSTSSSGPFAGSTKKSTITSVVLEDGVKLPTDCSHMFRGCRALKSVNAKNWDTSSVTNINRMFSGCEALTTLDVSGWVTNSVTNMSSMFESCEALTTLDVGNWNTSSVTDMIGIFWGCSSLTTLDLSGWDTSSVMDMGLMFFNCSSLVTLDLSGWNTNSVTDMHYMFENCSALTTIYVLPSFVTTAVTSSSGMFASCYSLIGGNGTAYDSSYVDAAYARIDTAETSGYFTATPEASVNWEYTVDDVTNTITLTKYIGESNDIVVKNKYPVGGKLYRNVALGESSFDFDEWVSAGPFIGSEKWEANSIASITVERNVAAPENCSHMFFYYYDAPSALASIDISRLNTGSVTDTSYMFAGCSSLSTLDVSGWNTAMVTDMSSMFEGCHALTELDVSGWNTTTVTNMSWMFVGCSSLTTLDVSDWDTARVTNMRGMFGDCNAFTTLDVSNWDTSAVTDMYSMFGDCSSLAILDVSNWNTAKVTDVRSMFEGCETLTALDFSNWDTTSVGGNNYSIFQDCLRLKQVSIGPSFNLGYRLPTPDVRYIQGSSRRWYTIDGKTYFGQDSGNQPVIPVLHEEVTTYYAVNPTRKEPDPNVVMLAPQDTWYQSQTVKMSDLSEISLAANYVITGNEDESWAADANGTGDIMAHRTGNEVILSACGADTIKANPDSAWMFSGLSGATKIEGLDLLDTSIVIDMSGMFYECRAITSIKIDGWETNGVTNMEYMFYGCRELTDVGDLARWDVSSVTNTRHMFRNCFALPTSGNIGDWNTSSVADMSYMFFNCRSLVSIENIGGWDTAAVENMSNMFYCCGLLTTLTTLDVSGWDTSSVTNMAEMFYGCSKLVALDVSGWNTSSVTKTNGMFNYCPALTTLDLSGWDTSSVTNMSSMFFRCNSLKTIYASSSFVTTAVTSSGGMFALCTNLVGGNGTKYSAGNTDATYACIDTVDVPGYFTIISEASIDWEYTTDDSAGTITLTRYVGGFNDVVVKSCYSVDGKVYESVVLGESTSSTGPFVGSTKQGVITSVMLKDGVRLPTDCSHMFEGCSALKSVNAKNWDTSSVKNMSSMFYGCSSLTELEVSSWNTSLVEDMSSMFENCSAIVSLDLNHWDTNLVTNMNSMFSKCSTLTTIYVLSPFVTTAVIDSSEMFADCTELVGGNGTTYHNGCTDATYAHIDTAATPGYFTTIPEASIDWKYETNSTTNTITLTKYMGEANNVVIKNRYMADGVLYKNVVLGTSTGSSGPFAGSAKKATIASVTLEDGVKLPTSCSYMFNGCSALESVNAEGWDTSAVGYMYAMFSGCSSLTTLDVSNWNTAAVRNMGFMFSRCNSLTTLDVSNWDTSEVRDMLSMFDCCTALATLNVSSWNTGLVTDMTQMFSQCESLSTLDVSDWDTGKVTKMGNMFLGCTSLTTLNVNSWNTAAVTAMSSMFSNCTALTTLDVSGWNTGNVTEMWHMFSNCSSLSALDVGNWNTSKVTEAHYMFENCLALDTIDVSNWDTGKVTSLSGMFRGCVSLAALDVSNWDTSKVTHTSSLFSGCSQLTKIDISNWNTAAVTNMNNMFYNCGSLTTICASPLFVTAAVTESINMFVGCTSLVGGNGTVYNSSYTGDTYARIDAPGTPGYFTAAPDAASLNSLDVEADGMDESTADGSDAAQVTIMVNFVLEDGTVVDQKLVEAIIGAAYDVSSVVELLPEGYEIAGEINGELAGEATDDAEVIVPVKAVLVDEEDPTPSPEPSTDETENGNGEEGENGKGEGDNAPSPDNLSTGESGLKEPTPEPTVEPTSTPTPKVSSEPVQKA